MHRKPVVALALSGVVLALPLALSGPADAPEAGEEVVLAAGLAVGAPPLDQAGALELELASVVEAGVAAQSAGEAVSVEEQPAAPQARDLRRVDSIAAAAPARVRSAAPAARPTTTSTAAPREPSTPRAITATKPPAAPAPTPPRTAPPTTRPPAARVSAPTSSSSSDAVWDRLALCESGNTNDPNPPYYGYWQFSEETWHAMGEVGLPDDHSRERQLAAAKRLQALRGWAPWPACAASLGLL